MSEPQRIQLRRAKGWKMPPNTVKCDRTTRWGNQFKVIAGGAGGSWEVFMCTGGLSGPTMSKHRTRERAIEAAVTHHRNHILAPEGELLRRQIVAELRGKNLGCWCKPEDPCHTDVLREVANLPALPSNGEGQDHG